MAKPSAMQWIPSGGVLAAAIGCGLLAAILVNVYAGSIRSSYEDGAQPFLQVTEDVPAGTQIQERNLRAVKIPKPLLPAFAQAVTADDRGRMTVLQGRKAPKLLKKDTFLWFPDFIDSEITKVTNIPKGCEMITIRIDPNVSLGPLLQPGSYVNIRGLFNIGSDPRNPVFKSYDVLNSVQVRAIGGSTSVPERNRSYDTIQIVIPSPQARLMPEIQKLVQTGTFTVTQAPEGTAAEPKIEKEVLDLLNRPRTVTPAPAGGAATPPPPPAESMVPPVPEIP